MSPLKILLLMTVTMQISLAQNLKNVSEISATEVEKIMKLPQDDWFELNFMGVKIGYAHIYVEKSNYNNRSAFRIRSDIVMEVKRNSTTIRLETNRESYIGIDFTPYYFLSSSNESGTEKRIEGIIENNIIKLKTTLAGNSTITSETLPPKTFLDQALGYLMIRRGLKVGDRYNLPLFSLELMRPNDTTVEVLRMDEIRYNGEIKPVFVVRYLMSAVEGMSVTDRVGLDGVTYQSETDMMGMKMQMIKTDMKNALGPLHEVDLIVNTKIHARGKNPIEGATRLEANLKLADGEISKAIGSGVNQKIIPNDDSPDQALLKIDLPEYPENSALKLPMELSETSELSKYLRSTVYIEAKDPLIRWTAEKVIGDETNSLRAVEKLCRWVYEEISDKNLKIGFASATQTLESLAGDCTEHTVLLTALARSIGIPSRVCAGLVFQKEAFYYHFWTEVYVGIWIGMDATLGQIRADANHIQLSGGELESDTMIEFSGGVMRTLNRLEIEVVESGF